MDGELACDWPRSRYLIRVIDVFEVTQQPVVDEQNHRARDAVLVRFDLQFGRN
jgi:hypothetical protein